MRNFFVVAHVECLTHSIMCVSNKDKHILPFNEPQLLKHKCAQPYFANVLCDNNFFWLEDGK